MGKWAKSIFGKEKFGDIGIVLAGVSTPEFEKTILKFFDKIVSNRDGAHHTYLVEKNGIEYPIVFNIYGAPAMVDVLAEMHDGGCRTVIFVGYAYDGFKKNLEIGSIIIPNKSYHFEGIYHYIEPDRKIATPDKELMEKLEQLFKNNNIKYINGTNVSVPAVTFQLPHANKEYKKIQPDTCEMELAACYSRAKDIGMRAAGVLVISDNRSTSIGDEAKKELRRSAKTKVLEAIIKNIQYFKLPKLKTKKEFNIDEHLAYIIEDPDNKMNIYKKHN